LEGPLWGFKLKKRRKNLPLLIITWFLNLFLKGGLGPKILTGLALIIRTFKKFRKGSFLGLGILFTNF